jgi:Arc/MetJ family transcription regulator
MGHTTTTTKTRRPGKQRKQPVAKPDEHLTLGEYLAQAEGTEREPDTYVRTNIMLNERLLNEARELTGLQTKKEIVERALKMLVRIKRQEGIRKLQGKLHWDGNLEELRRGRDFTIG